MKVLCRFAPSPTGFLHVGNIRAAIINYLFCAKEQGSFMLRFDDTDKSRVKEEYKCAIKEDMKWMGIEYDQFIKQSDRVDRYNAAKDALIESGRIYPCYETDTELKMQRKNQTSSGSRPLYNRHALNLTSEEKVDLESQGRKPYYRFLLEDKKVSWEDNIKGRVEFPGVHFSDPVVFRDNGIPTYTFCSVVDDIECGITDVIRGEDHITNTAIQIQIFEALIDAGYQAKIPNFAHLALVKASEGKISKRIGGFDIRGLRSAGIEAMALTNFLAQIGTSKPVEIKKDINDLVTSFSFEIFNKSATNYDLDEVMIVNHKYIQLLDYEDAKDRINEINSQIDKKFYEAIKPNLNNLNDLNIWFDICKKPFRNPNKDKDKEFLSQISELLPLDTIAKEAWSQWLSDIKQSSDRKGKSLFMPIREALTGKQSGPELKDLINVIDRKEILARLLN